MSNKKIFFIAILLLFVTVFIAQNIVNEVKIYLIFTSITLPSIVAFLIFAFIGMFITIPTILKLRKKEKQRVKQEKQEQKQSKKESKRSRRKNKQIEVTTDLDTENKL